MTTNVGPTIERALSTWDGAAVKPHRFGGEEFVVGKREIGHNQRIALLDLPCPGEAGDELGRAGKAERHILPERGWVSYSRAAGSIKAINLLKRSYTLAKECREHSAAAHA